MPLFPGIFASAISGHLTPADAGSYYPLGEFTVPSGGLSTIQFTNIPQTYSHLQLRFMASDSRSGTSYSNVSLTFNSDTANNYSWHYIVGDNRPYIESGAVTSTNSIVISGTTGLKAPDTDNKYGVAVIDILDYTNQNKYKTLRALSGHNINSGGNSGINGQIAYTSGNWRDFDPIDEITITPITAPIKQYSHFALYGVKA